MPELVVMRREDFEGAVRDAVREGVAEAMRDVAQRPGDWLTEQEAAALLGVATSTLRSWRTRGRGPAYSKRGRVIMYQRSNVTGWIRAGNVYTQDSIGIRR